MGADQLFEDNFYEKAVLIDNAIADGVISATVVELIKWKPYNDYFFKRANKVEWLSSLIKENYFLPQNAPIPFEADEKGLFNIPEWNVLPYMERVSQQVSTAGNEKYINDLLAIIKNISNYTDASGQHIDNYRTWYYFTKVLVNLPTDYITDEIFNLIPNWLASKFSTSLPGAEITGKLLPKFLNSDKPEDWEKAERLIEIITDIKWVPLSEAQKDLHELDMEARTLIEPHWLKKGFEKNFERIGKVCSIRVINVIAERLLEIFCRQYDHAYDADYEGRKYQIAHSLHEDGKHEISVNLLKYPENWDGYSRSKIEKTLVTSFVISDFESKASFMAKVKEGLIKNAFGSLGGELDEEISAIYSLHDYTYIGYSSLTASSDDIRVDDTIKILIYILTGILTVKAHQDKEETGKALDNFLSRNYPYPFFKRLVLYVAGKEWDKYKEYFFKLIKLEEIRCFEESDYAKGLRILLKDNFDKFNADEKEIIKRIIDEGPHHLPSENPEEFKAYWKQKWLSLVKNDPLFAPLYEEQSKLTGVKQDKFSFGPEFKTSEGFGTSPFSAEEIMNMTNADLAIKFKDFRSEKKWEGMTVAAFAGELKEAVKSNPLKFTDDLNSFKDVGFIYLYKILDGLKETWKEKKAIDWGKIFDFISPYIKTEQFWKDEYVVEQGAWLGGADHKWISGITAELIQEGTKDDSWAFSEEYFDKAQEIIFTLIEEPEEKEEISDYVSHALNTPCGKLITALVYLSLRIVRINDKKGANNETRWPDEYKGKFTELLDNKVIDAYTFMGRFLPNLAYLDKKWLADKVSVLVSDNGSKQWVAFFEGYLSIGKIYDDLYELMKPHYRYGLSLAFKEKHNSEHLIQHICITYLRGHEKLDDPDSLFRKIVDAWVHEQIREVVAFFWSQRDYMAANSEETEKMKIKIIEFWRVIYEKYKDKGEDTLTREDKLILSVAGELASFLAKIDSESYEWLLLSAPYVHENFNSNFFIEYLNELKDKGERSETARFIGNIYLRMLDKFTPDYDEAHILSIVEFLYDSGEIVSASKICNIYGARGNEFLRDIYEKHSRR